MTDLSCYFFNVQFHCLIVNSGSLLIKYYSVYSWTTEVILGNQNGFCCPAKMDSAAQPEWILLASHKINAK